MTVPRIQGTVLETLGYRDNNRKQGILLNTTRDSNKGFKDTGDLCGTELGYKGKIDIINRKN